MKRKKDVSTLTAYGETSDAQVRGDETKVTSLGQPKTRKDTALLANVLTCLSSVLECQQEAEWIEAAHFFVFAGERRYRCAGACRYIGMHLDIAG
jgi:hypothetical protein